MNFDSDISLFWLLPWAVISVFLALWLYRGKSPWLAEIATKWKRLLIALRAASLFLLGILFIGIIFQAFIYRDEKPVLVIGVDASTSMLNYKDSSSVKKKINELLGAAKTKLGDKFDIVSYQFGADLKPFEKADFKLLNTDLSKSIEQIRTDYFNRNLGGILMVSDGNFNQGSNPVYAARKLTMTPVYTIGVGDTIYKRDHFVKNVAANDLAFLNNEFPVLVDIEGNKMGKSSAQVTIELNGQVVASQSVNYDDGISDFKQVSFNLTAKSVGFQRYTVRVDRKNNEFNYENNSRSFYIEVVDSRSKILILADAPHPDMSALKSVWDGDENLEIKFVPINEWDRDLKNVDLIVWHEAGRPTSTEIRNAIMNNGISKLLVVGPNSERSATTPLGIGLGIPSSNQTDEIEGTINNGFQQFEISDELVKAFKFYPPLKSKFGQMSTPNNADILAYQRVGPVVKKDPQIFFGKMNQFKYGVIYGEGLWRWKMAEYARTESTTSFTELVSKIGQFLLVKQNASPLRVNLPKKFLKDENVIVNASFLNESLEQITTPTINFNLKDEKGKESKMQFGVFGDGYKLDLGQLKPGKYSWKANTKFGGKAYAKEGIFIVEDLNNEQLDTRANHTLLNQLAQNSGGKFNTMNNYQKSLDDLLKRNDLTTVSYQEASFNDLIEYWWVLLLLILLLGTEWFLRRWLGSY